jgi:hypothetical protein
MPILRAKRKRASAAGELPAHAEYGPLAATGGRRPSGAWSIPRPGSCMRWLAAARPLDGPSGRRPRLASEGPVR